MGLAAGDRLEAYEILGPLGAGGMGRVYRARDPRLGREVAIKVLPEEVRGDAERLRRFELEARATGGLNHPNVLAVHDLGQHEGAPYLVTELLEGQTLREQVGEGPLPWRKALEWGRQIATGLAAAHDKGIVHRDLKPENLFVTKDGRVKILDFGLAKVAGTEVAPGDSTLSGTDSGTVLGTAGYMAPEQVRGRPADARSDIFALGAVLYEMLAGRRAFEGESKLERAHAILSSEPPELEALGASVPPSVEKLVRRCLEKSPDERLQSARDLAFALDALLEGSTPRERAVVAPARRRWPLTVAALGALALATGALAVGRATRPPASPAAVPAGAEPPVVPRFTRVTYRTGLVISGRFAEHGRSVVYAAELEGEPPQVYLGTLGRAEARPLTEPWVGLFAISKQNEMALAIAPPAGADNADWGLSEASLAGGAPRAIAARVVRADYRTDGTLLLVREQDGRHRLEHEGKVLFETDGAIESPRFSPSGDAIAFLLWPIPNDDRGTVELLTMDGARRTLAGPWFSEQGLAWAPSGDEVWYTAAAEAGSPGLRAVDRDGHDRLVLEAPGRIQLHDIAPDGRVLLAHEDGRFRVFGVVPGESGEVSLSWFDGSLPVDMTPDGRLLLFMEGLAASGTEVQAYLRPTDGSPAVHLGDGYARALSADGRWALLSPAAPFNTLVQVPTGPGEARPLPPGSIASIKRAAYFADGRRILILGREAGRPWRLWVQDLEAGPPRPVGEEGLEVTTPPSPDGRWAVARRADRQPVLVDLSSDTQQVLDGLGPGDRPLRWTADGRSLFVLPNCGNRPSWPAEIFTFEVATKARTPWRSIEPGERAGVHRGGLHEVLITPDGRYYVLMYPRTVSDLFVVEGLR